MTQASASIATAASQIVTLINSRPVSPRQDEIEAILASLANAVEEPRLRAEWDTLVAACEVANEAASELRYGDPIDVTASDAAEELARAAADRVDDCVRRIRMEPARNLADIRLLAEVVFRALWTDGYLDAADADERLDNGPENDVSGAEAEALAALLRAIRAVSRRRDVFSSGSSDAGAFARLAQECRHHCNNVVGTMEVGAPGYKEANAAADELTDRVHGSAERLLRRPFKTWGDFVECASIIAHYAEHDLDALGEAYGEGDIKDRAAEKLALAILRAPGSPTASLSGGANG